MNAPFIAHPGSLRLASRHPVPYFVLPGRLKILFAVFSIFTVAWQTCGLIFASRACRDLQPHLRASVQSFNFALLIYALLSQATIVGLVIRLRKGFHTRGDTWLGKVGALRHCKELHFDARRFNDTVLPKECPICMIDFCKGVPILQTPCGHVFHEDCLTTWTQQILTCPMCRADVRGDSPPRTYLELRGELMQEMHQQSVQIARLRAEITVAEEQVERKLAARLEKRIEEVGAVDPARAAALRLQQPEILAWMVHEFHHHTHLSRALVTNLSANGLVHASDVHSMSEPAASAELSTSSFAADPSTELVRHGLQSALDGVVRASLSM